MSEHEHENPDAEPDEPITLDDGEGDGGEPDDPEAAKADAGPSSAAVLEKADKENRRYMRALEKILGEDETRHECPTCNGLGVTWGEPEALLEVAAADDAEPCPACNALGVVKTGSKQPGQETKPCGKCGGRGWREKIAPLAAVPAYAPTETLAPQVLQGQYVPGVGFIPYGQEEPIAGSIVS
jgi:transcription elongation factor Elf1